MFFKICFVCFFVVSPLAMGSGKSFATAYVLTRLTAHGVGGLNSVYMFMFLCL